MGNPNDVLNKTLADLTKMSSGFQAMAAQAMEKMNNIQPEKETAKKMMKGKNCALMGKKIILEFECETAAKLYFDKIK